MIRAGELGPVIPRAFPPAPGWSPGGYRIKTPLEHARGPEKTWVYGGLRFADGQEVTIPHQRLLSAFLQQVEAASPHRQIVTIITGNLSSHDSKDTGPGWNAIPAFSHVFIPRAAAG